MIIKEAVELKKLNVQSLFSSISLIGPKNFLESYLLGYFFKILDKHRIAFLLTLTDTLFVRATSMMVSETEDTRVSGTMVAIIENAKSWAGSFLDLRSDYMAWMIVFHTA